MNPLLAKALERLVRAGTLTVIDHDGATRRFGDAGKDGPAVTVRFADDRVGRQILTDPRLGAAEAYMDGRLLIEAGDVMDLATLVRSSSPYEGKAPGRPSTWKALRQRWRQGNHRQASRANVAHHYDLDDRLYDRFLDPWWQYSCAYWIDDAPDLAAAQRAKIAHIAAKLDLRPGQRVLDIGCGWGGLGIALAKLADVEVVGITLSTEQRAYAEAWAAREGARASFHLVDYRDAKATFGAFDRVVSVGMFEHVGVPGYPDYFGAIHDLLTPDGVALVHTIGRIGGPGKTDDFTRKYIFPGGYIPALSETVPASEAARLILTDVEVLRLHYAKTLRAWYSACVAERAAIEAVFDARFWRMWTFYLAGATAAFEHGGMVNFQLQFARDRRTLPLTRDYMAERERAYRAVLDGAALGGGGGAD